MVKQSEKRGGPVTVSFMGTAALVSRVCAVAEWIDETGEYAPANDGPATMSHVYRLLLERGLESFAKEMK